ncbi:MAG: DUF4388 domain-containing protein [Polyangiaceae bacterium]|jgi:DNA-binding response OmpR family regulator
MEKLLLVDADVRSARMVDVGLRKSGFRVWVATDGADALGKVDALAPELVIADVHLPTLDGRGLVSALRARRETATLPVIFLVSPDSGERGRRSEVENEEWVRKPVVLRELISRIHAVEARRLWQSLSEEARPGSGQARVSGSTGRLAAVDLIRAFDVARRSGKVHLRSGLQEATVAFRDGRVVDAEFGRLRGEEAVYRALMLRDALFDIDFGVVSCEDIVRLSMDELLSEGFNRLEETLEPRQEPVVRVSFRPPSASPAHSDAGLRVRLSTGEAASDRNAGEDVQEARPEPVMRAALRSPMASTAHVDPAPRPVSAAPAARAVTQPVRETAGADRAPSALESRAHGVAALASPAEPRLHDVAALAPPPNPRTDDVVAPAKPTEQGMSDVASPPRTLDVEWPVDVESPKQIREQVSDAPEALLPSHARARDRSAASQRPERPSRTVPPLVIHAQEEDAQALGVPRTISPAARYIVGGSVLAASVIIIVGLLSSSHARQVREAEEAHNAAAAFAAAPMVSAASPVPSAGPLTAPAIPAVAPETVVPVGKDHDRLGEGDAVPGAKTAAPGSPAVGAAIGAPRVQASPVERGETALVAKFEETGQSPTVLEAERALARGATSHAVELAQKAVAENPADADAWLTLGAAREASGDPNSARLAYRSCVAQAHTVGLTHCRVLAERQAGN